MQSGINTVREKQSLALLPLKNDIKASGCFRFGALFAEQKQSNSDLPAVGLCSGLSCCVARSG